MEGRRTYAQVARAEGRDRNHASMLDAAEQAFFAGHWQDSSLERIAGNAGVTKQTLLRHFGSKENLLAQTYARGFAQVRDQRMSAPADDIEAAVDNLLDHYGELGERGLRLAAMDGDRQIAALVQKARELHYDWADHAFGGWLKPLRAADRRRRRAALIALCDVNTWWLLSHDLGFDRSQVRSTLIFAIRRLLEEQP
jgi:AcrR family transcriptional regulator